MTKHMYQKLIYFIIITILFNSCSKDIPDVNVPANKDQAYQIYKEGVEEMNQGQYFIASKKFSEAEAILPEIESSAKASLMASYCLYLINFYDEAELNLERFVLKYAADKNKAYAYYLLSIIAYEQILDEKKDIAPLNKSKKRMEYFLKEYPNTEYAIDLKFKIDLINNQLAAKELYVAKYYIETQKWIPAINRLKIVITDYETTIYVEEALHRLVEVHYIIGLEDLAKQYAKTLGYNYQSSEWYEQSYKIFNKNYDIKKLQKEKTKKSKLLDRIKSFF